MYCWLLLQIYLCCLCLCSRDTYEVSFYLNNFSNNATVVLEGFRTTFFKSQRPSYSLALIAVASFCAFLSLHQCETNSGPQCCEGFIPLSMEQQSHKESTDNSPLSEDGSVVRVRGNAPAPLSMAAEIHYPPPSAAEVTGCWESCCFYSFWTACLSRLRSVLLSKHCSSQL